MLQKVVPVTITPVLPRWLWACLLYTSYSCHPRAEKFIRERNFSFDERVRIHKPLVFHDYNQLQIQALAVVSDSGTLPEEAAFFSSIDLGFPAVCIRTSTERPEAMEKGNFILAGIQKEEVLQAVALAIQLEKHHEKSLPVYDYIEPVSYTHLDVYKRQIFRHIN